MWWTKTTTGFVARFPVTQGNGALRTGLVAGDFTATVVNPADTATLAPAVSEVASKAGLYEFTVTSSFLGTHGVGEYGVVVEVDTFAGPSGAPHARDAFGGPLRVSLRDLDDLSQPGDEMDLVTDAVDASSVATDAIDADALAADAVAEISDGVWDEAAAGHVAGGSFGAEVQTHATSAEVAGVQSDTDDIQTRLPASLTGGGRMRSHVEAFDAGVIDAAAVGTGAIDADAIAADAITAAKIATDAIGADELAATAVGEIADGVWDEAIADHSGAGSAGLELQNKAEPSDAMTLTTAERAQIVDDIWDETLADHLIAGSTGKALDDAQDAADAASIADAVWDEAIADHQTTGTFGLGANLISIETTVVGAPAPTAVSFATGLTEADDFWNEAAVVVIDAGGTGRAVPRTIALFANTDGLVSVDPPLPFTPTAGDPVIILRLRGEQVEVVASGTI